MCIDTVLKLHTLYSDRGFDLPEQNHSDLIAVSQIILYLLPSELNLLISAVSFECPFFF